ncbi:citrate synthase/methylcitrate synthase [Tuberibacillus calidus]|jgi:citrate synthase|uniref:citrate synthase/methylcitrate synthase n=1 Tax=Tuberibacillus calidus TaxID=340097 RepID=UPI000489032F|nr:citrate synthase/methylcitrate synthase [Tuberibacillus calidus]
MSGLENVVAAETVLSDINGDKGQLIIRGIPIEQLAGEKTFEEAVYFLWTGRFPNEDELQALKEKLLAEMTLEPDDFSFLNGIPTDLETMAYLMTALSGLHRKGYTWPPDEKQAAQILGKTPAILGYLQSRRSHREPVQPKKDLGFAGNYLYLITGEIPSKEAAKALDTYFTLTMEHGLNASTFTARVITSTQSDLISAIVGAMGALKGPLHGGAPKEVIAMLEEIGTAENAETWLREKLEKKERIMGFGHRVYRTVDPRANVLRQMAGPLAKNGGWFSMALEVERVAQQLLAEYKPHRPLKTNVEFYAAAVFKAIGLPETLYTATFATSRIAGWCAHALEQAADNRIIRPSARYIGPVPNEV